MPTKAKKPTKFETFKSWLLKNKKFRFGDVTRAFGPYASSEHIYLNSLRRHRIVKKVARGQYVVASVVRLKGITTGDLHAKSQAKVLRRKLEQKYNDTWNLYAEIRKLNEKIRQLENPVAVAQVSS